MLKRLVSIMLVISMMTLVFAGCGTSKITKSVPQNQKTGKKTTITYMTFSAAPDHIKDLEQMISKFEAQNPDIEVKYETVAFNDYFTKLQTLIAGGTAPDTFELNYENFVNYASKGALMDLSNLAANDKSFDPSVYDKNAYDVFKYNGKQYALVESFSNVVLFYNKDLFDKAGVPYPNASWTWKDELAAAQKLTDAKNGIWGTYAPIQFWEFYKTIAQNGGSIFSADKKHVTLNSKQNVEALQWMIDKVNKYHVTPTDAQMSGQSDGDLFKAGKIAMLRTGIWMFSSFKDAPFHWDIALEPGNTQKAHHFFANGVAISSNSKNAEAAWKWIKFFTSSKDAAKIRVSSNWELPALSDKSVMEEYLNQRPPEHREVVFEALKTLVVPPVTEKWNELTDIVGKELDAAKLGQKTPQQALDDAQKEVEQLLK